MADLTKHGGGSQPKDTKSLTVSSASTLSVESLGGFSELGDSIEPLFLVAPNKAVQALWRKEYPGVKVMLAQRLPQTETKLGVQKNATRKEWQNHGE